MSADWNTPTTSTAYATFLSNLKTRDVDALTLCLVDPTNTPTGAFKYLRASNKFQEWNGSSWDDKVLAIAGGGTGGATASAARSSLGLGTIATQDNNNVNITGGSIGTSVNIDASRLTSNTVPLARLSNITNTEISAAAAIVWTKISKSGSSLADLATRSASDLSSGTLADARLNNPAGIGITGNAGTATTLQTARNIAGVSFNGSANIAIPSVNLSDYVTTTSWTPTFTSSGGGESYTYDFQEGYYLKLGKVVFVTIRVRMNNGYGAIGSGYLYISNLPFAAATNLYQTIPVNYSDGLGNSRILGMLALQTIGASTNCYITAKTPLNTTMFGIDIASDINFTPTGGVEIVASGIYITD